MDMIHGEGWDEIGDVVAEGTLHVDWKFDFRELNHTVGVCSLAPPPRPFDAFTDLQPSKELRGYRRGRSYT